MRNPLLLSVIATALLAGCGKEQADSAGPRRAPEPAAPANTLASEKLPGNPLNSTNIMRAFQARGVIRSIAPDGKTIVLKHEEIPGFMSKMTMEFDVRDTNEVRGLAPGETVTFVVKAAEEDSWIENIQRAGTDTVAVPIPSDPPASALLRIAELKTGDVMPDAELLAENGHTVRLSDFRGSALAFTFIFTRCPLPEYCPRMNQNFRHARNLLIERAGGPTNWQFLSISFDPEFDKPGVLTRYADSYRGASADRWLFAAAPTNVMAEMASKLDFRFANEGGSFIHNLRTVVLDTKGRIFRQFDGNKWKAQELADASAGAAIDAGKHTAR